MYKLCPPDNSGNVTTVFRKTDFTYIPIADDNADYIMYKKWLEEGNTPEPADETVVVEPTIEEKLASVGLSINDLKSALGLK